LDVDEPIVIVGYDPAWVTQFNAENERIRSALADLIVGIEHFGSTAVPGMIGKPIVDLLVGLPDLSGAGRCVPLLESLGYHNFGEIFIPDRFYLRKRGPPHFNVALTAVSGEFWITQLRVRDYLRNHPEEVHAYCASKQRAYAAGARMFSTYSQAKGPFLAGLIERASAPDRG
jgi:GrpB-like predicted nucleotidyltransferase (UPF0157 family)